jgi:methylated-DNA-[protein]-cysteine S-methyltransferase
MIYQTVLPSPIGPLRATAEDDRLTSLSTNDIAARSGTHIERDDDNAVFRSLATQLESYWAGEPVVFDVPISLRGTPFQTRVWNALRDIPYGHTISYGELARQVGQPSAVRAVGRANGANPIAIVIPCHRVIGGDGSLTGYAGGLERKRALLLLEDALAGTQTKRIRRTPVGQV